MLIAGLPPCPLGLPSSPRSRLARKMREASWALGRDEEQQPRESQVPVTHDPSAQGQGLLGPVVWLWGGKGAPACSSGQNTRGERWRRNK